MNIFKAPRWNIFLRDKMNGETRILTANSLNWYADPFVFEKDGKPFVFVEVMPELSGIGNIAVFLPAKNKPTTIISEKFHMSFPCIFLRGDEILMIPETSAKHQLIVYKCSSFPLEWSRYSVVLDNVVYVDSIPVEVKGKRYLISYDIENDKNDLVVREFDLNTLTVSDVIYRYHDENLDNRPAGNAFVENGLLVFPSQKREDDGSMSVLLKYYIEEDGSIHELARPKKMCSNSEFAHNGEHTFNSCGRWEIFDLFVRKFDLLRPVKGMCRTFYRLFSRTKK